MQDEVHARLSVLWLTSVGTIETVLCPLPHGRLRRIEVRHLANQYVHSRGQLREAPTSMRVALSHLFMHGALTAVAGMFLATGAAAIGFASVTEGRTVFGVLQILFALLVARTCWHLVPSCQWPSESPRWWPTEVPTPRA